MEEITGYCGKCGGYIYENSTGCDCDKREQHLKELFDKHAIHTEGFVSYLTFERLLELLKEMQEAEIE